MNRLTNHWALVLAGGDGTRLQELTRLIAGTPIPKQYCRIVGERSLLESTLDRIRPLAPNERTLAIVTRNHLSLARPQLATLPADNVLVQPSNRDTGPGLLFALLAIAARDPEACVAVFPSDHYVADDERFRAAVRRARRVVEQRIGALALVGIRPDHVDTGMGYIEAGGSIAAATGAYRVARFHEKPGTDTARALVASGALWNAFVMAFRVRDVLALVATHRPQDFTAMTAVRNAAPGVLRYDTLPTWNFSSDFLRHITEHLVVVEAADTGWSDWGTRDAIERTLSRLGRAPQWGARAAAA